ncbi:hypothetical protein OAD30_00490 [Alphaproteobacteria bacterium]|nr:hypothetical protein [Alphaproteobacteria bacterium]
MSDIKSNLCEAFFSIMNHTLNEEILIEDLCEKSGIQIEEAQKILPLSQKDYSSFFLKILIKELDQKTLEELQKEFNNDNISSVYDKILEGIILRFEIYTPYKLSFKTLSIGLDIKTKNFFNLLSPNQNFMLKLLNLAEGNKNECKNIIKSLALNIVYFKTMDVFLKEEKSNLEKTIRILDNNLREIQDIGDVFGIIKK